MSDFKEQTQQDMSEETSEGTATGDIDKTMTNQTDENNESCEDAVLAETVGDVDVKQDDTVTEESAVKENESSRKTLKQTLKSNIPNGIAWLVVGGLSLATFLAIIFLVLR